MRVRGDFRERQFVSCFASQSADRISIGSKPVSDANSIGTIEGAKTHTLVRGEIPNIYGQIAMHWPNEGGYIQRVSGDFKPLYKNTGKYRSGGDVLTGSDSLGGVDFSVGGNGAHANMQPSLHLHYIIKM